MDESRPNMGSRQLDAETAVSATGLRIYTKKIFQPTSTG